MGTTGVRATVVVLGPRGALPYAAEPVAFERDPSSGRTVEVLGADADSVGLPLRPLLAFLLGRESVQLEIQEKNNETNYPESAIVKVNRNCLWRSGPSFHHFIRGSWRIFSVFAVTTLSRSSMRSASWPERSEVVCVPRLQRRHTEAIKLS